MKGGLVLDLDNLVSRKVRIYRSSVKSIYDRFTELHLKEIARDIVKIMKSAQYIGSASLDSTAENYEKKYNRGVRGYVYYKVEYKGLALRLNMEIINNEEIPYMVNIIKEESHN